jgi:UDP-glucose 4-epimerase
VLRRFLATGVAQIRIFSRDEKKHDDMRHDNSDPKLKFHIGDVRQLDSLQEAMSGVDFVFHAAALILWPKRDWSFAAPGMATSWPMKQIYRP